MQGPNPSISGTAVVNGLAEGGPEAGRADGRTNDHSALDEAELREVERAEYYPEKLAVTEPRPRRRGLLDRLFRR